MINSYYLVNGKETNAQDPCFGPGTRIYRYGDGFFESMRFMNKRIYHLALHIIRIRKSAMLLQMELPENFDEEGLENQINDFCSEKNIVNARIRICFLRDSEGRYLPDNSQCCLITEITPVEEAGFPFNETGLKLGAYKELTKNSNFISTMKTTSALIYVLASIYAQKNYYDDCIIYNDFGRISEATSANIFIVSGEFVITPPLSEYCIDGVMRKVVMRLAEAYGYTVAEQPITEMHLQTADEIFITNAAKGINWIGEYKDKTYKHTCAKVLSDLLNKSIHN